MCYIITRLVFRRARCRRHRNGGIHGMFLIFLWTFMLHFLLLGDQTILPFFCIQAALKRNCELHKLIKHPYKRYRSSLVKVRNNLSFLNILTYCFVIQLIATWLNCFLLSCGDIQPNPGPVSSSSSDSSINSASLPPYDSHLSICHLNIQSILPKIDILQHEMQPFDIFVFTET